MWGFRCLLDAGGRLWVWIGSGLAWHSVHGSQELIGDPSCLPQPTQQSTVDRGRVVSDRVFTREEQTWNRLQTHTISMTSASADKSISEEMSNKLWHSPVRLQVWQDQVWWAGPWDHSHYQMNRLLRTSKTHGPKGRHASDSPPSPLAAMTTDTEHIVGLLSLEQSQTLHTTGKSRSLSVWYIRELNSFH